MWVVIIEQIFLRDAVMIVVRIVGMLAAEVVAKYHVMVHVADIVYYNAPQTAMVVASAHA